MKEFDYYNRYGLEGTKGRSYPSNDRGSWNHEPYHHTAKGQMYEINELKLRLTFQDIHLTDLFSMTYFFTISAAANQRDWINF